MAGEDRIEIRALPPRPRRWHFWIWNACGVGGLGLIASLPGLAFAPLAKLGLGRIDAPEGSPMALILKLHEALWLPSLGLNAFNVVASAGLLAGSLLCSARRGSGGPVLRISAIVSIAYEGFKLWFLVRFWGLAVAAIAEQAAAIEPGVTPQDLAELTAPMIFVGDAVFILFGILLAAFYAGLARYAGRPDVRRYTESGIRVMSGPARRAP